MQNHLWFRLLRSKAQNKPVQSPYAVVFEDPDDLDAPARVYSPDPHYFAAGLAGGVLPPVECYLRDLDRGPDEPKESPYAEPIGPMTPEQMIEYLIKKDIPPRVWRDYRGNRKIMKIVPVEAVPSDRTHRMAWAVPQPADMEIAA